MRHMMRHEVKVLLERPSKKLLDGALHLTKPQPERFLQPRIPPFLAILRMAHLGIERIGHVIDIAGGQPGMVQAKTDRAFGQLMRVVELRRLAVLDAVESFFLDGRDKLAIDQERGGRLVIHRINSKNIQLPASSPVLLPIPLRRFYRHARSPLRI